jgi:hypothetical protein
MTIVTRGEYSSHPNMARAVQLEDGMVISFMDVLLEYEDKKFYEVVKTSYGMFNPQYERTGKSYTIDELNSWR